MNAHWDQDKLQPNETVGLGSAMRPGVALRDAQPDGAKP